MIAISDGALVVRNLTKTLVSGGGFLGPARKIVRAVNDISFTIPKGMALGLVGVLLVTLRRMLAPLRAIKTTTTELSAGDLTSTTILATNRSGEIACALVVLRDNLVERRWLRGTAEAEALGKRARQEEVAKLIEDTIRALRQAAEKIGAVTGMIKAVADRTNMLSLNATIEAARAGDAGKGFAIGTSEVKGLAQQPTASTGEISALVASMQEHTQAAVSSIEEMSRLAVDAQAATAAISAAILQQQAGAAEISRSMHQTSQGSSELTRNIDGVSSVIRVTNGSASEALRVSDDLSANASRMRGAVENFLSQVRQA